jgi:hypothetical protein
MQATIIQAGRNDRPSPMLLVRVSSATWIVTVWWAWIRPRAIFCPTTITIPVLDAGTSPAAMSRRARALLRHVHASWPRSSDLTHPSAATPPRPSRTGR